MITSWDELPAAFPSLTGSEAWLPRLQTHAALLEAATARVRTTSVPAQGMIARHFSESLELLRILDDAGGGPPLVDVGPGGGFPGLVIASVRPHWKIALVEPLKKRSVLLSEVARSLGLAEVAVHAVRGEEAGRSPLRESATIVTARAVAPLAELLEYCVPLATVGGLLVLPKGQSWKEELEGAASALAELGCVLERTVEMRPEVSATPIALLVRKVAATDVRYPRRPGIPRKRPL
jgi:16S rRNA (guanine527-N7)-methyltransferase